MDALKSIWKSKKSKKGFKGQGHVLGNAPPSQASKSAPQSTATRHQPLSAASQQSSKTALPQGRRLGVGPPASSSPSRSSHAQDSRRRSNDTRQQPALAAESSSAAAALAPAAPSHSAEAAGNAFAPVQPQHAEPNVPPANDDIQDAVALLRCDERPGAPAIAVLTRLLRNIVTSPQDPKFRRLRLQNPKIKEAVVEVAGGIELLQACGFDLVFESAAPDQEEEGFAILTDDAHLPDVHAALYLISPNEPRAAPPRTAPHALPAQAATQQLPQQLPSTSEASAAGPSTSAEASESQQRSTAESTPAREEQSQGQSSGAAAAPAAVVPRERNTQVLIPTDVDASVPDWVFERSPAELKAAIAAARRKREQGEVLMTRAMRERLTVGDRRPQPTWGTIRVRMPEGLLLQGDFAAGEPCLAVFAWLTDCLRDPGETYRLVQPRVGTLAADARTIRDAGLLPQVLLHFQRDESQGPGGLDRMPALSQALLAQAAPSN